MAELRGNRSVGLGKAEAFGWRVVAPLVAEAGMRCSGKHLAAIGLSGCGQLAGCAAAGRGPARRGWGFRNGRWGASEGGGVDVGYGDALAEDVDLRGVVGEVAEGGSGRAVGEGVVVGQGPVFDDAEFNLNVRGNGVAGELIGVLSGNQGGDDGVKDGGTLTLLVLGRNSLPLVW